MLRIKTSQIVQAKAIISKRQEGRCALCGTALSSLAERDCCLDHDHKTGLLRGVLCRNCNGVEGKVFNLANRAKRDGSVVQWLMALLEYYDYFAKKPGTVLHPTHKTDEEKRVLRNKRARVARAAKKKQ